MENSSAKKIKLTKPVNLFCIVTVLIDSIVLSLATNKSFFLILISAILIYIAAYAYFEKRNLSDNEQKYEEYPENKNNTEIFKKPVQRKQPENEKDFNIIKSAMFSDSDNSKNNKNIFSEIDFNSNNISDNNINNNNSNNSNNTWRSMYNKYNVESYDDENESNQEYKNYYKAASKNVIEPVRKEPVREESPREGSLLNTSELTDQTTEIQDKINNLINKKPEDYDGITADIDLVDKLYSNKTSDNTYRMNTAASEQTIGDNDDDAVKRDVIGNKIIEILNISGITAEIINIKRGAAFSNYEIKPLLSSNLNKIKRMNFEFEIKLNLGPVRIGDIFSDVATINIEIPNDKKSIVYFSELVDSPEFINSESKLKCILGTDVNNKIVFANLRKIQHLLITGEMRQEINTCLNVLILSLLYKKDYDNVNIMIFDITKRFSDRFNNLRNLYRPVIDSREMAINELNSLLNLIETRLDMFSENGVNDIISYNRINPDAAMPQIVIFISELSDITINNKNNEKLICDLLQQSRSAGIYFIIATENYSERILTNLIKVNIPSLITFKLPTEDDSLSVIDISGAEKLLKSGDMLYYPKGSISPKRVECAFVSDSDIDNYLNF